MPIKSNETQFQLTPQGINKALIRASIVAILGIALIVLAIILSNIQGIWVLYIFAGMVFIGVIIYLIIRIRKTKTGALPSLTIDVEGIRLHSTKEGIIKRLSWEDDPKISTAEDTSIVDEDEGITLTYVSDVIFTTDEDRLILPLDDYVSLTQNSEKLVEEIEQAARLFKKKHRQLTK